MPRDFFEQMDAAGILVNGGFQCCDAWQVGNTQTRAAGRSCTTPR